MLSMLSVTIYGNLQIIGHQTCTLHGVHTHNVKHETLPGGEKIHGINFLSGIYLEDICSLKYFNDIMKRKFNFIPTKVFERKRIP